MSWSVGVVRELLSIGVARVGKEWKTKAIQRKIEKCLKSVIFVGCHMFSDQVNAKTLDDDYQKNCIVREWKNGKVRGH